MAEIGATLPDGTPVRAVRISNDRLEATILDYGARLVSIRLDGGPNMTVAAPDIAGYAGKFAYFGPICAPVVNRIGGATAIIEGRAFRFPANQSGRHSLHSGDIGTHGKVWEISESSTASTTLSVHLPDGEGGFPGNRTLTAAYVLDAAALTLDLSATSDAPTLMNPAHHGVWNLDGSDSWRGHDLMVPANMYLPVDDDTLPTGEVAVVGGTPYDHRTDREPDPTLDHNFCFDSSHGPRARLRAPSGRTLEVHSDAPGLQVYAGGAKGIALEPQLWPDAPNNSHFPSILLRPGETFRQRTHFEFSA